MKAMQNRGLKTLILTTALTPSLIIALALGTYFNKSRSDDINQLLLERSRATALQMANVARSALRSNDVEILQEMSSLALEEPGVNAVAIFDGERRMRAHAGPPLVTSEIEIAALMPHSTLAETSAALRIAMPVLPNNAFTSAFKNNSANEAAPLGWVVVEYSRSPYQVDTYQSLFIGGLIVVLALLGAVATAVFASRRLENAVTTLRQGIQRIANGEFDTPVQLHGDDTLRNLAEELNQMAAMVQNSAIELRRNLEQTNRDLRESLETVEVQNIELDLARREALEASRIKSEFLANTSHELRTPLNGIIGFSKLLLKSVLDARQREYLETIRFSAEALLGIINDILDFSKMEAGKLILDNTPFNLREVIEDTLTILAPSTNDKKLDLILLYDPSVPMELIGDPLRLRQILTNLISNAIKFTQHGEISIQVILTGAIAARVPLKISVTDTGIGIDAQQQQQLFKAFTQADASTSREFGGTGLGLAISKRLVEHMGGEIGLSSEPGSGSTFWFSLRLPMQEMPLQRRQFEQLAGKHLLLYDPLPLSRQAMQQLLHSWQIDVTITETLHAPATGTARCDGWLLNLANGENLPPDWRPQKIPVWLLHSNHNAVNDSAIKLLSKPIGHIQLYDVLCDELCPRSKTAAQPNASATGARNLTVLAVDDNPTNLKLIAILLDEMGATAVLANSGREALAHCERQHFDLILLDIQMPELNGAQVAEMIRNGGSENRATRIVALTAHLLPEEQRRLLEEGFDLCLIKPITENQLRELLESSAQPKQLADRQKQPVHIELSLERARNRPDLAKEFLRDLLRDLPALRAALFRHHEAGDLPALLEATHRLHGASCYCGAQRLQQNSYALEEQLKQNSDEASIVAAVDALLTAIDELLMWESEHDLDILFDIEAQPANTTAKLA